MTATARAGYLGVANVSPDGSTWATLGGVTSFSGGRKANTLDASYLAQGDAVAHNIVGLTDGQWQLGGDILGGDAGQAQLLARLIDGADCYLQRLPIGTTGQQVKGLVSQYDVKGSLSGKVEWNSTLEWNAAPTLPTGSLHHGTQAGAPIVGHHCTIMTDDVVVTMTGEACSQVGSTKTYKITNSAHRIIDPRTALVVKDGGSAVDAANIASIDYLFGKVTFVSSYTPGGAITLDGAYVPTASLALAREFGFSAKRAMLDASRMGTSFMMKVPGLISADFSFKSLAEPTDEYSSGLSVWSDLANGTRKLVQVDLDGSGTSGVLRAWVVLTNLQQQLGVTALNELNLSAVLARMQPIHPTSIAYTTAFSIDTP